jgi:antitoxin component YwqK of YwqJK toxin-antitoxin module
MKLLYYFIIFSAIFIFESCSSDKQNQEKELISPKHEEALIEFKNGIYTEYYPGRKKIKIQGAQNNEKQREGKWVFFSETGLELSITYYKNGKRTGHSIVKYPNGSLRYVGEYENDQMIGVWKFYDEKGNLTQEKDYGSVKK